MIEIIDHIATAKSRLSSRFKNSTLVNARLEALMRESQVLENLFNDIITKRSVDDAGTAELDMLGELVGQARLTVPSSSSGDPLYSSVGLLLPLGEVPITDASNKNATITNNNVSIVSTKGSPFSSGQSAAFSNRFSSLEPDTKVTLGASLSAFNFSADLWFLLEPSPSGFHSPDFIRVNRGLNTGGFRMGLTSLATDVHRLIFRNSVANVNTVDALPRGVWHHFAVTYQESISEVKLYLNGVNVATQAVDLDMTDMDNIDLLGGSGSEGVYVSHLRITPGQMRYLGNFTPPDELSYLSNDVRELSNAEYRVYLKAKIAKNHSGAGIEDIIQQMRFVFGCQIAITSEYPARVGYIASLGKKLSSIEKDLLRRSGLIPKPSGVKVTYSTEYLENSYFGFQGSPGARGFGRLGEPDTGGTFARLLRLD